MKKKIRSKHLSAAAIADIYIKELRTNELKSSKKMIELLTIDNCLTRKKIYFDQMLLDEVLNILLKEGYIEHDGSYGGVSVFMSLQINHLKLIQPILKLIFQYID